MPSIPATLVLMGSGLSLREPRNDSRRVDARASSVPRRVIIAVVIAAFLALPFTVASAQEESRPTPETVPAVERPDLAVVRDAVTAYRRGDLAAGDALRRRVETPAAGAFLDWAALRLAGVTVPFDRVAGFWLAQPGFPNPAWLRRRSEDALLVERRPAPFVRAFFARERPQTVSGKIALAQAFRADGLSEDADALVRETWRNDTFGRDLELRILDLFKDTLATADHRFRMERFLLRENWESAKRAAVYAGGGHDALVKARIAVDARAKGADKVVDAVPAPLKSDASWLFSRTQNLRRGEKPVEAAKLLAELTRDPALLVDGDAWWVERRLVARKLLDDGDAKAAYGVVTGHGATTAERRIEADFLAGWIALRSLSDPVAAARHFDRAAALAATPISRARAGYWQGRAREAAGASAEAKRLYAAAARHGIAYYGQLAAARLGAGAVALRTPADPAPSRPPLVGAIAIGYAAGFRDLAYPMALDFARGGQDLAELEQVAAILTANGDARGLLAFGKLSTQRGLPLDEAAFPTSGVPAFDPVGRRVEPAMVHAIARQESAFDPAAGSSAGARGLMQLMPGTASATAKKAGLAYEPGRILDGVYNAQLGAAHLGDLMEDWRGSFILTFASYNAGPGNVRKWIAAYGDPRRPEVDAVDWVERIPFSETRNYVQRVMENLQVYRKRLDPGSPLSIESDLKAGAPPAQTGAVVAPTGAVVAPTGTPVAGTAASAATP